MIQTKIARGLLALVLVVMTAPAAAQAATLTRAWQFKPHAGASLDVRNFDGEVRVETAAVEGFHVTATVRVEQRSAAEAERLARALVFRTRDVGPVSAFHVEYPKKDFPKLYRDGGPRYWWGGVMYTDYLGQRRRLTGDADEAAPVRVDLLVRAPAGARVDVRNKLGDAVAQGFEGDLLLDTGRGSARSGNGKGRLELDTGSGDVEVRGHAGPVRANTGSGRVAIEDCRCDISADTGSGEVSVRRSEGSLRADTGSGAVRVDGFVGPVHADTGSGSVRAEAISGLRELDVDTGSGSVSVVGDLSALERLRIDTGSGSVRLRSSAMPSLQLAIDTGSGGVHVEAEGATISQSRKGDWSVRLGAGAGRGIIDTGSGSVDLRISAAP